MGMIKYLSLSEFKKNETNFLVFKQKLAEIRQSKILQSKFIPIVQKKQ